MSAPHLFVLLSFCPHKPITQIMSNFIWPPPTLILMALYMWQRLIKRLWYSILWQFVRIFITTASVSYVTLNLHTLPIKKSYMLTLQYWPSNTGYVTSDQLYNYKTSAIMKLFDGSHIVLATSTVLLTRARTRRTSRNTNSGLTIPCGRISVFVSTSYRSLKCGEVILLWSW